MKLLARLLLPCLLTPLLAAADDEALVQRGRALYHGHAAYARGVGATPLRLPVEMAACARCHGATGEGGREGGQPVPALRWQALRQARAGQPALADDAAVLRAIAQGHGRGGAVLDAAMPRFTLQPDEGRALLAYLRRLGTALDRPPGVLDDRIRLGTVVPLGGPGAATGEAIAAGLRAGFAEANARGGVHGRRIDLQAQDARAGVRAALAAWRDEPVYALVGGLWNEAADPADALLAEAHLSHVATLVVRESAPRRADWSADLLAPLAQQREALAEALRDCGAGARLAVAHGDPAGAPVVRDLRWLAPQSDLRDELRRAPTGCIGYTLARAPAVQSAAPPAGWAQTLVLPMPAAVLQPAAGESAATPWYRLGLAAARLTTELLSRAGRQLHERALLDELDRMPELALSPGLLVHYGRQRRHAWSPLVVPLGAAPIPSAMASRGGS
ncbi:MAG: ABC transporter substrate-binding protein [Ottowia sp.]|uniref:ABC transporter substrate-binding protein n=1 Tax=Ottowia sp. TaxID=1898956 RepID=UPI0039E3A945